MKLGRCPVCKSHIHIEGLAQDDASRELLGRLAKMPKRLSHAALSYIGLFRPEKSDLSNGRALKLLDESLALCASHDALIEAMSQTVSQIHAKRQRDKVYQPLKNHNYLKQVLESVGKPAASVPADSSSSTPVESKEDSDAKWREQMRKYGANV